MTQGGLGYPVLRELLPLLEQHEVDVISALQILFWSRSYMFNACLSSSPRRGILGGCIGHDVDER